MTVLISITLFLLGSVMASFAAVIAERLHTGQPWLSGRSCCNSCGRMLGAGDLVPILSWIVSRGRCRACKCRVPVSYAVSEALLGTLFLLSYLVLGLSFPLLVFLAALSVLAFIVLYDLRHTVVPSAASALLMLLSLGYALLVAPDASALGATLLTAGVIALGFLLLYALSKGRAMGLGDSPVALSLSLLVGPAALAGLLFSFWIGAVVGIAILVSRPKGHRMGIEVPFVPFLAAGYLLAYFTQWNPLALAL